jgi:hypothetical protein
MKCSALRVVTITPTASITNELARHADVYPFAGLLLEGRLERDVEHERRRVSLNELTRNSAHAWHSVNLGQSDWGANPHFVAFGAERRGDSSHHN